MGNVLTYLSFRGRANRARFWLTVLAIWAIMLVTSVLSLMISNLSPFFAILFLPIFLAALVASLANATRRLHDRGKSAWWLLVFVVAPSFLLAPAQMARTDGSDGSAMGAAMLALLALPLCIWSFVELGCLKGTPGPNKYGDDPLVGASAEPAIAT